jgi:DNA repair exonuclease SbcCD nuclease subunit
MDSIQIVILSDLHFGPNKNNDHITHSLETVVYPYIAEHTPDMIVVAGDDTDERISLDQSAARHHVAFVNTLIRCKKKDGSPCSIRFVSGTETHQKNQLQAYDYFTRHEGFDVKLIRTVTEENYQGLKLLYIPEESVQSKEAYYASTVFSGKKYAMVFGHGTFDFIGYSAYGRDSGEKALKGSPLWSYEDFKDCVTGAVIFGHVHIAQNYKDFIYYGGSLTRFAHGEEKPKGFLTLYYSYDGKTTVSFIENPAAPRYVTRELSERERSLHPEQIVTKLQNEVMRHDIYELRVLARRSTTDPTTIRIMKKYFQEHPEYRIRLDIIKEDYTTTPKRSTGDAGVVPAAWDSQDWESNTIRYAKETFNYSINRERMHEVIAQCKQFLNKE